MKKNKWRILNISSLLVATPILLTTVSCSNSKKLDYLASSSEQNLYSNIWNFSLRNEIENTVLDMTVEEFENEINNSLKKNSKMNFVFKAYCFTLLWDAFKNPLTRDGKSQQNLSKDILEFSSFLSDKVVADNKDEKNDDKKTFNNLRNYINSFDYEVSIINIVNNEINKKQVIRDLFNGKPYVLNFQIKFKTTDEETNNKMVLKDNNKSIMFTTNLDREERKIIQKISKPEIKEIASNQFKYQSTKLFYDVNKKEFSTIILPSNIYRGLLFVTPNSGFGINDKKRSLFAFDWKSVDDKSKNFDSFLIMLLKDQELFNTSLNNDWKLFLRKEKLMGVDDKVNNLDLNLRKNFHFDNSKYES